MKINDYFLYLIDFFKTFYYIKIKEPIKRFWSEMVVSMKNSGIRNFIFAIFAGTLIGAGAVFFYCSPGNSKYVSSDVKRDNTFQGSNLFDFFGQLNVEDEVVPQLSLGCYAYSTLDSETRVVYDEVYYTLINHSESREVSTANMNVLEDAVRAVYADHGEIFWVSGYSYIQELKNNNIVSIIYEPTYTMDKDNRGAYQTRIDSRVNAIISNADMTDDFSKVKSVYDWLAENVEYNLSAPESQNILSAILYKETVCQGYADAMQYLLTKMGVQCSVVSGIVDGDAHTWCLVRMDGDYYYVDPTLAASIYSKDNLARGKFTNYTFFGVTTKEILMTHSIKEYYTLPVCTANKDNYFVHEGLYITEWDEETIGQMFADAYNSGQTMYSIRFSDINLYDQATANLITLHRIKDYINELESIEYISNYRYCILTLKFR